MERGAKKTVLIIGSAPVGDWRFLRFYCSPDTPVLCADGGRQLAEAAGLRPTWYIGDGDSGGSGEGLPGTVLPAEKDVTDLEAAVQYALSQGYEQLYLTGCTGGRADHHLANCFLLEGIAEAGATGCLLDDVNEITYLGPGTYRVNNTPACTYLGLIPLDREITGVTLRGVKYPLTEARLKRSTALTVSNEILPGQTAEITIGSGAVLLVRSDRRE